MLPPVPLTPREESRLLRRLKRRPPRSELERGPALLVSLPRNDAALAKAAAEAGADALKVHINVHHDASGTQFGSFAAERPVLEAILGAVEIPVGLMVGAATVATRQEVEQAAALGFDFLDAFAHHMPAWMLAAQGLGKMAAVDATYDAELIAALAEVGAEMVETAIIPHEGYGERLTVRDLAGYRRVRQATNLPLVVPSQRRLAPDDLPALAHGCGVQGIMIGAIVTGDDAKGIAEASAAFRRAMDDL